MFGKALINAYLLGNSNPKDDVHSQPHNHFCMKHYKKTIVFHCFFFFIFFFTLTGAMRKSALERLRCGTREKEVERKAEAFRKEHIEKKIA